MLQFLYIGINDKTNVITRPFPATDHDNATITIGGRGDTMDTLCPTSFSAKHFKGHVVTLVKSKHAAALKLATSNVDPLQLEAPTRGGTEETKEDAEIPSEHPTDRIGWMKTPGPLDQPVFAALRAMLPLPPGINPPIGLDIRKDELPVSFDNPAFPALKIWFEGMKYLWNNNRNISLHHKGYLFKVDDIGSESVFTTIGYPPVISPWISMTLLIEEQDEHYENVLTVLRGEKRTAILRLAENANIPSSQGSPTAANDGSPSSNNSDHNRGNGTGRDVTNFDVAHYKNIFDGLAASKLIDSTGNGDAKLTITEKEQQTESEDVISQYQLLFGRLVKGIDPLTSAETEVLVYPKISGQFKMFLKTHRPSKAAGILQAHVQAHAEKIGNSDKLLDGFANLDPAMFDAVFAATLRKFAWATEVPNVDHDKIKSSLGIYHFAQVRAQSQLFTQRVEQGRILIRQEDVDEDKSRRERKNTDLYHYGLMRSREEILVAIANFYSFSKYMVDDMDTDVPTVIKALLQFVKVLNSMEGRKFGQHFRKHPEIFHSMLMDTQQIINNFTRIATRYEYRQAVQTQKAISVDAYKTALQGSQVYMMKIYNAITQMSMDQYNVTPLTMVLFQPPSEDKKKQERSAKPPNGANRSTQRMDIDTPPRKDPKKKNPSSKGTPGILKWGGNGNIPFPNVWIDKTDGSKQKLCANFTFQDRICKFPECTFFHAKTPNDLAPSALAELQKWVLNKDKVEFTNGNGSNGQ